MRPAGIAVVACLLAGCGFGQTADEVKRLGVFAKTSGGLVEVSDFANQEMEDSINQGVSSVYRFANEPQSATPTAFIVNVPEAAISASAVYLLDRLEDARWYESKRQKSPQPIKSSIENVRDAIYKVSISDLPRDATGFVCIYIHMPLGTPDRLYAVKLGKK
jgi:hypothetical protein